MVFNTNEGKRTVIEAGGKRYARHAVRTHFITLGEDYIEIIRKYVLPVYQPGDIVSSSEKVIAMCQGRVVTEEEAKPGLWAKILAKCACPSPAGIGMSHPMKMQFAINQCGLKNVLWAAVRAAIDKLRGRHGTFYAMLGREVSGLDGFYGKDIPEYEHIGVRIPEGPDGVCDEVYQKLGIKMMIVDANDLNVELLGCCKELKDMGERALVSLVKDNPAGQGRNLTPFVLIREM